MRSSLAFRIGLFLMLTLVGAVVYAVPYLSLNAAGTPTQVALVES